MKTVKLFPVLFMALLATGCVLGHKQFKPEVSPIGGDGDCVRFSRVFYHQPGSEQVRLLDPEAHGGHALVSNVCLEEAPAKQQRMSIAVIEFDDEGNYWDRSQFDAAKNEIVRISTGMQSSYTAQLPTSATARTEGIFLVVYVHGWRNNASEERETLSRFRWFADRGRDAWRWRRLVGGGDVPESARSGRARPLTIYVAKASVRSGEELIEEPQQAVEFPVNVGGVAGRLFVKRSNVAPPGWLSFFEGQAAGAADLLRSSSSAAVLVLRVGPHWFAVTFGYGRNLLRPGTWEPNFGLKVTLNAIDDASIRSVDRKTFDTIVRHTREEASRAGSIEQFGLNVEEDLLRAVVGRPLDEALGTRLAGMDALTVSGPIALVELPERLERYVAEWGKRRYQRRYPWIDHVAEIRDRPQIRALDERLVERMAAGDIDRIWLAVPEPVDWSRVGAFKFSASARAELADDVEIWRFVDSIKARRAVEAAVLRARHVHCMDVDGATTMHRWPVYQCLYAEIADGDDVFLLTGGSWYRIAQSFASRVNEDVRRLGGTRYRLPPYGERFEEAYNRSVAHADEDVLLMDRRTIRYGGGASAIEFCDLVLPGPTFLHVKRYGGSSVLSHLFAQGVVSATLFLQDPEFRQQARTRIGPQLRELAPVGQPRASDYEIGFAIVSRIPGTLELPFFSKVNLRGAARTLGAFGYKVTLTKIEVAPDG